MHPPTPPQHIEAYTEDKDLIELEAQSGLQSPVSLDLTFNPLGTAHELLMVHV